MLKFNQIYHVEKADHKASVAKMSLSRSGEKNKGRLQALIEAVKGRVPRRPPMRKEASHRLAG